MKRELPQSYLSEASRVPAQDPVHIHTRAKCVIRAGGCLNSGAAGAYLERESPHRLQHWQRKHIQLCICLPEAREFLSAGLCENDVRMCAKCLQLCALQVQHTVNDIIITFSNAGSTNSFRFTACTAHVERVRAGPCPRELRQRSDLVV